jgi:hypothetical protein
LVLLFRGSLVLLSLFRARGGGGLELLLVLELVLQLVLVLHMAEGLEREHELEVVMDPPQLLVVKELALDTQQLVLVLVLRREMHHIHLDKGNQPILMQEFMLVQDQHFKMFPHVQQLLDLPLVLFPE